MTDMTEFTLVPYVGALPIRFDMTSEQVRIILREEPKVTENDSEEIEEDFGDVALRYNSLTGELSEIAFVPWGAQLLFEGVPLIGEGTTGNPIPHLLAHDKAPVEVLGFLLFLELGLATTGYHDNDPGQRSITIFRKGHWDEFLDDAEPYEQG